MSLIDIFIRLPLWLALFIISILFLDRIFTFVGGGIIFTLCFVYGIKTTFNECKEKYVEQTRK